MIIRKTADAFTLIVTILLWIAVAVSIIVTMLGIYSAAENVKYGGTFS